MDRTCKLCALHNETRKHYAFGMCASHHGRWRRGTKGGELTRPIRGSSYGYERPGTPKATRSPETKDLYWAAGFIEGDGCFSQDQGRYPKVSVGQVQKEPLLRLQEIFGGAIYTANRNRDNEQDGWQWAATGARARGIIMTLYVIMSPRRQAQIKRVLEWTRE